MNDGDFTTVRIVVGVALGAFLGLLVYDPKRTEKDQQPSAVMFLVGLAAGFCFAKEIVVACVLIASMVGLGFLAPHLIRLLGQAARKSKDEIDSLRGKKQQEARQAFRRR